jgi:tripartite-type tricarboxylate transporter receptor subunit TctC
MFIAGCSGGGGDGDGSGSGGDQTPTPTEGGDSEAWPPRRNTVEFLTPTSPGDTRDTLPRLWANNAEYPEGITTRVTPTPGAGGLIAVNQAWNADLGSGQMVAQGMVPMGIAQLTNDAAQYEMSEFEQIMAFQTKARAIQVSPRSTDVESHWDWDWETFTTKVKEENLRFGATAITQFLLRNFIERYDPNLEEGDIEIVPFDAGGNARATIKSGELDGYFGGYGPNYPRDEFYYTQFVIASEDYPAYHKQAQTIDEDTVFISDTSFPEEDAKAMIDATIDGLALHAPPGTPSDVITIHEEAMTAASEKEELRASIANSLGAVELNFGTHFIEQEARDFAENKIQTLQNNSDLIPQDFS